MVSMVFKTIRARVPCHTSALSLMIVLLLVHRKRSRWCREKQWVGQTSRSARGLQDPLGRRGRQSQDWSPAPLYGRKREPPPCTVKKCRATLGSGSTLDRKSTR